MTPAIIAGLLAAMLAAAACDQAIGPTPSAGTAPLDSPSPTSSGVEPGTTAGASRDPLALMSEQDGVRLEVRLSAPTVEATRPVTFSVKLTNLRATPLQHGEISDCFAVIDIWLPLAPEPGGQHAWAGRIAEFKTWALAHGSVEALEDGPVALTGRPVNRDCPGGHDFTRPLAPGASISARFLWNGRFGPDLPSAPGPVMFEAWAWYTLQQPAITIPPVPTTCPCARWEPRWPERVAVRGQVLPGEPVPPMASLGQVVDGALANEEFRTFVSASPFETCITNLYLPGDQGAYLPHRPGWVVELLCDSPRRFIRVAVDPWTAELLGIDRCLVACQR